MGIPKNSSKVSTKSGSEKLALDKRRKKFKASARQTRRAEF